MIKKTSTNITYCNPNDKSFIVTEPILINNNNNLEGNLNNNHSTRNRIRYNYTTNNLNNNLNLENEVLNDDINLISNLNINKCNNKNKPLHININQPSIIIPHNKLNNNNLHNILNIPNKINNNNILNIPNQINNNNILNNNIQQNNLINNNNLIVKKEIKPKYFNIFKNFNIFNSLLISLNNISFIMDFFSIQNNYYKIKNCEARNNYCLSSILYHIYNLLWHSKCSISEKELIMKYINLINYYQYKYSNNYYFSETKNNAEIIGLTFGLINFELSQENLKGASNAQPKNFGVGILSEFKRSFALRNKSIISDKFVGIYKNQKEIKCSYCQNFINDRNKNQSHSYSEFFYINFNLNEIGNSYPMCGNGTQNINLYNCFDYTFVKNNKKSYYCICKCLQSANVIKTNSIFSLPYILSIVLSNNDSNNFILETKLNLKKYSYNCNGDGVYYLISVICKLNSNGQFVNYCFNIKNGKWLCYSIDKIKKVKEMSINAIPQILFYQLRSSIPCEYKELKKEMNNPNIIKLDVKFNKGIPLMNLAFNKYIKIKEVKQQISYIIKKDISNFHLLINGIRAQDDKILINVLNNYNNDVLVWIIN